MHDARPSSVRTTPPQFRIRLVRTVLILTCLTLAVRAEAAPIAGRVTGPDGRPVPGAIVVISGTSAAPVTLTTGADGRFAADVPEGQVDVRAFAPGMDGDLRRVASGRTDVELRCQVNELAQVEIAAGLDVRGRRGEWRTSGSCAQAPAAPAMSAPATSRPAPRIHPLPAAAHTPVAMGGAR